jgi:hypothetical protein
MRFELYCPGCGIRAVDFETYHSAVMLAPNLALMQFDCPCCQTPLHVNVKLSLTQQDLLRSRQTTDAHKLAEIASVDEQSSQSALDQPLDTTAVAISYSALQVVEADSEILQILVTPPTSTPEAKSRLQYFHEQLEQLDSVDEAIWRIDASRQTGSSPEIGE